MIRAHLLLLFAFFAGVSACATTPSEAPDLTPNPRAFELPFMLGVSMARPGSVPVAEGLGISHMRPTLAWNDIEPTIVRDGSTLASVRSAERVSQYIREHDFSMLDEKLHTMTDVGITPLPIVGHGYTITLPLLDGEPAGPDALGHDEYLARQYLVTRAIVERYDGDGIDDEATHLRIELWQTENELNQAFLGCVLGQRNPTGADALGSLWQRFTFLTEIIQTLRMAVHDADATALTTHNFHTDIHPRLNHSFSIPSWQQSIELWRELMDIVSYDAYPNYYRATPLLPNEIEARANLVRELADGRPVIAMEVGYPTGPLELGFGEEEQAEFLRESYAGALRGGVNGFFWFGTRTLDTHEVVISEEDRAKAELIAQAFDTGDTATLLDFLVTDDGMAAHMREVLIAVENYWGLVRPDGSVKPAWNEMATISTSVAGGR